MTFVTDWQLAVHQKCQAQDWDAVLALLESKFDVRNKPDATLVQLALAMMEAMRPYAYSKHTDSVIADMEDLFKIVFFRYLKARYPGPRDVDLQDFLADRPKGMRVNIKGLLGSQKRFDEIKGHLDELATRFYAGDIKVVDEFLQLYCLDDKRPNSTKEEGR